MSNYKEDLIRKLLGTATTNPDNQVNIAISSSFADKISSYSASQSPRLVQFPPLGEHPDTFLSICMLLLMNHYCTPQRSAELEEFHLETSWW